MLFLFLLKSATCIALERAPAEAWSTFSRLAGRLLALAREINDGAGLRLGGKGGE